VLECVLNLSEGRDRRCLEEIASVAGDDLLDLHADPDHHRAVLTLVGEEAARAVSTAAIERLDLREHAGAHPRIGVVDVVPFVPLAGSTLSEALAARGAFAGWLAETHGVPAFLYGPERTLPELRRQAFRELRPDLGPIVPHPTAGATAVGARPVLVAYNLWMAEPDLALARRVAAEVRSPDIRALGLQVGARTQVSMNLVAPLRTGPATARALVRDRLGERGAAIERAELVGLVPEAVLRAVPEDEWSALDLGADRTIEARLARRAARVERAR
jgi:glutamate formiminotransferase